MNLDWRPLQPVLGDDANVVLHEVLLDFQGPHVATWQVDGVLHLGVASDDDDGATRWTSAPVSAHELRAIKCGAMTVYELLCQPSLLVFDQMADAVFRRYEPVARSEVPEDAFPQPGVPLPDGLTAHYRTEQGRTAEGSALIVLDGVEESDVSSIRVFSDVLNLFQRFIDAIAQSLVATATRTGAVAREIRIRTDLRMRNFAFGSAVFTVEPSDPVLFDRITERARTLTLAAQDDARLAHELAELGPRVRSAYDELLAVQGRNGISLFVQSATSSASVSRHSAPTVRTALAAQPVGEVEEHEVTGHFTAFDSRGLRFEFIGDAERASYRGPVSMTLLDATPSIVVGTGTRYQVWLQYQTLRRPGGETSTEYLLMRVAEVDIGDGELISD